MPHVLKTKKSPAAETKKVSTVGPKLEYFICGYFNFMQLA